MNKKISLGLAVSLIFIAIALSVSITMTASMRSYNSIIKDLPSRSKLYSGISEIDELVRDNYQGEINDSLLNANIAYGYARGLGDKHSYYLTAAQYAEYKDQIAGKKIGIGIIPFYHPDEVVIYVSEISEHSPAALAGLQKGDKIIAVDEEKVSAYNYKDLITKLVSGDNLSNVAITYKRDSDEELHASVTKGYDAQTVYFSVRDSVGYVKITEFYDTTAKQLKAALDKMMDQGATKLILDVRGCQTGTIDAAASALDVLVPVPSEGTGALATAKGKDGSVKKTYTAEADSVSMPMQILVNHDTAGPAELFACDLRDYGKAQLVGETTAGNGTMQEAFPLSDGGALVLSMAIVEPYISPSYNINGLTPDHIVELDAAKKYSLPILSLDDDDQYQKAYSILSKETETE